MWINLLLALVWFFLIFMGLRNTIDDYNENNLNSGTAFRLAWTVLQVYFLIYNLNAVMLA